MAEWKGFETAQYQPQCTDLMRACFAHFDHNRDGTLNEEEFHNLCCDLFTVDGAPEAVSKADSLAIMKLLGREEDGKIGKTEFEFCWKHWFNQVLTPRAALVVVDVQNDFIDGSLALRACKAGQNGAEVVPIINKLLDLTFDVVIYTKDLHPPNHMSFFDNLSLRKLHSSSKVKAEDAKMFDTVIFDNNLPLVEQTLWPRHCVVNTSGAELHPDLKVAENHLVHCKGEDPEVESYSVFIDNIKRVNEALMADLRDRDITDIYTCGLAYDICVGMTTMDAHRFGYRTMLVEDAARGTDVERMNGLKRDLLQAGCLVGKASEVPAMLSKRTRSRQWGLVAAQNAAKARKTPREQLKAPKHASGRDGDVSQNNMPCGE